MKIVYYTHTAFFEVALSLAPRLAERVELHLLLEITPTAWQTAGFDLPRRRMRAGILPGDEHLAANFPPAVRDLWRSAASFELVVHGQQQSVHPASLALSRRVVDHARRDLHGDLIHIDDVDPSPRLSLGLAAQLRDLPLVLSVHDPLPHSGEANWRKSLARRLAYPRADHFVLHNHAVVDAFIARYRLVPDDVTVAHLAPYEIFRAWQPDQREEHRPAGPSVLFFGRLSPYKGIEVLYQAAPIVAAAVPDVTFIVAGMPVGGYVPPDPPALVSPASIVEHRRHLDNSDLARLFDEATLVVCPYLDATQSGVIEIAQAFGKPVVASRVGGLPEYVHDGETGLLVPPADANALADALIRLLTDDGLRTRMGRQTLLPGATYSWRDTAESLSGVYDSLAGGGRRRRARDGARPSRIPSARRST